MANSKAKTTIVSKKTLTDRISDKISRNNNLTKPQIEAVLTEYLEETKKSLIKGEEIRLVYKDKKYESVKVNFPNQKGKCYGCMFGSVEKDEKVKNIIISFQEEDGWKTEFNYCNDWFLREKWWLKTDKSLANEEVLDIIETRIKSLENFPTPSPH